MPKQPNILLFMTDQQRFDSIGALGNPRAQTPAHDRLVTEGTTFTSAYCPSPVCVSSRCSLVLGRYPHATGCVDNMPMPLEETSVMQHLSAAGYQCHGIGKMHFAPRLHEMWGFESRDTSEEGAGENHFTQFLADNGFEHVCAPHGVRSEFYYIPQPSQLPARLHHTQWVGDRAIEFLEHRDRSRPFFLWTSWIKPHPPFENPEPWMRLFRPVEMPLPHLPPGYQHLWSWYNRLQNRYKYRDQGRDLNLLRTMRAAYYAAVSFIDHNMGRVLDWLQKSGELDNTLIVHTSDHGEFLGDYDCYGKRSFLDVAARVPLLVRYPAAFEPGQRCDQPVSLVDFGPTCLAAAGAPACTEHVGEDLAAVAAGSSDREYVIGQIGREDRGMYMLCARDFKYIYSAPDDAEWLLPRIAGELESRSVDGNPAYRNVQQEMRQALIDHFRADGYETPLEGDGWKRFPAPPLEAHPDGNLLYQDGRKVDDCFPDGYAPRVRPGGGLPALSQR